jgi:hypothetical protein
VRLDGRSGNAGAPEVDDETAVDVVDRPAGAMELPEDKALVLDIAGHPVSY